MDIKIRITNKDKEDIKLRFLLVQVQQLQSTLKQVKKKAKWILENNLDADNNTAADIAVEVLDILSKVQGLEWNIWE